MRRLTRTAVIVLVMAMVGLFMPDPASAGPAGSTADPSATTKTTYEFRPDERITRAQAARMLHRIAGEPAAGVGCGGLKDVPSWAREAICWLVNNDYATGYGDGTFRPDRSITRAEAARMFHRIAGEPAAGVGCGGLWDVPSWAREAICWLVNNDYATGYGDGTFRPAKSITRAQAARMLHRIAGEPAAGAGCGGMSDVPTWAHQAICWLINNDYASGYEVTTVVRSSKETNQATAATLVNNSRASHGLRSLRSNATLMDKAQNWAQYLARIGYLKHSNLSSGVPSNWKALAENVGYGSRIGTVHTAFMRSSGHRANILGNYTHLGTGVAKAGDRVYVVHVFMRA